MIDRGSKTPIYRQIYEDIDLRIKQGEYSLGSLLPSESKLCSLYGVERATVRRALSLMVDDGKVAKMPGLGTSVIKPAEPAAEPLTKKTMLFLLPRGVDDSERISEPFNTKLMDAMERECHLRGFDLLYKSFAPEDTADSLIRACNPCGVYFVSAFLSDLYITLHKKGIPSVLVNQSHPVYPSVCLDNRAGSKMVIEYVIALGHTDIGFIGVDSEHQTSTSRLNGYKDTLTQCGLTVNPNWVVHGDWSLESGKQAMKKLLSTVSTDRLPTAIFAANDSMAIGAMIEAQDSGYSVPGDFSIVGFDNIDQSSFIRPSLTTVAVDYDSMSRAACMLMQDMLEHNSSELNVSVYVPLYLIDRESTRKIESSNK